MNTVDVDFIRESIPAVVAAKFLNAFADKRSHDPDLFIERATQPTDGAIIAAWDAGQLIGAGSCGVLRPGSHQHIFGADRLKSYVAAGEVGVLESIAILPPYDNFELWRRIVELEIDFLTLIGCTIILTSWDNRSDGRPLLLEMGFRKLGMPCPDCLGACKCSKWLLMKDLGNG